MVGWGSRDAFLGHPWLVPGSSAALTSLSALPQTFALPSPTAQTTFPLSGGQTAHHVFPKKAIPTCPIYLWKGGAHSLSWPGHPRPCTWVTALWSLVLLEGKGEL